MPCSRPFANHSWEIPEVLGIHMGHSLVTMGTMAMGMLWDFPAILDRQLLKSFKIRGSAACDEPKSGPRFLRKVE